MKLVKIIKRDERIAKNGIYYAHLTLEENNSVEIKMPNGKKVIAHAEPKISSINVFSQSNLDGKPELLYTKSVGDEILGGFETRIVEPFEISGVNGTRVVDVATCFVVGNSEEASWSEKVASTFRANSYKFPHEEVIIEEIENIDDNISFASKIYEKKDVFIKVCILNIKITWSRILHLNHHLKKHDLTITELNQLANYCWILKSNTWKEHWKVNELISNKNRWDEFDALRSRNHHASGKSVKGILPIYFSIVCKVLKIGPDDGSPLLEAIPY